MTNKFTDKALHEAMRNIDGGMLDKSMAFEFIDGWENTLPYFGWFWRDFDWDRVPLGYDAEGDRYGIMGRNKWYYQEYYCDAKQSTVIRAICESLATEYTQQKVRDLASYIHGVGTLAEWVDCDREAIDAETAQRFADGKYSFISLEDLQKLSEKKDD